MKRTAPALAWMKACVRTFLLIASVIPVRPDAQDNITLTQEADYRGWGWGGASVIGNGIVTLAVLPQAGARAMQYDIGTYPLLRINTGAPLAGTGAGAYFDGGGFITWPVPQDNWNASSGVWPPPPAISHGTYTSKGVVESADSVSVTFESGIESTTSAEGLGCSKTYTLYRASSRVRYVVRLFNTLSQPVSWSIREVAQVHSSHGNENDNENFYMYFPKGVSAKDGSDGYWLQEGQEAAKQQFTTDIVDGIVELRYAGTAGKVCAHPGGQWLAYVDRRDGWAFIQKASYDENATYPEYGGAVVLIWMGGWLEAELCAPEMELGQGDSNVFGSDWYATKMQGPVAAVTDAGAVQSPLEIDDADGTVRGTYGVFYRGTATLVFDRQEEAAREYDVDPSETFELEETVDIPEQSGTASVLVYDYTGALIDTLDAKKFRDAGVRPHQRTQFSGPHFSVRRNAISVSAVGTSESPVSIRTLDGRNVLTAVCRTKEGYTIDTCGLPAGTYVVTVVTADGPARRLLALAR